MLEADTVLKDRYRIVRPLGQGGMASVYLARHIGADRLVAVKVLHADKQGRLTPGAVRQFREEVEMTKGLSHPTVPEVYEFFELSDSHCLVMEYIPGRTLDEVVRAEGPLDEGHVLGIAGQLCLGLHYLHGLEPAVIYRDLKPGNVMLTDDEAVKLIDFGIAKYLDEKLRRMTQTTARGMLSRGYAAVEQYIGGTDHRSDIYALGATLFNLLTAEAPPESLSVATGKLPPADLRALRPDVTERTAAAVQAMLEIDRTRRPQTVLDAMASLGLDAATPLPQRRAPRPPEEHVDLPPTERVDDGPPTEQIDGAGFDPSHPAFAWTPPQQK